MIRALAALAGVAALGCASEHELATQLVAAAQPGRLPRVVACWETAFEASGFQGEYVATVDFVIEGGTSRLRDAKVRSMEPADGADADDGAPLAACVEAALNASALPREADQEGPGFAPSRDLAVRGYRLAFTDASPGEHARAAARHGHVLLGPRADRCQGLYAHDPPRDASTLSAELAERKARAASLEGGDQDLYARELQKAYDAALELRARLKLDAEAPDLRPANRRRIEEALGAVEQAAREAGARIGCERIPDPR